jgi:hypothetical protein
MRPDHRPCCNAVGGGSSTVMEEMNLMVAGGEEEGVEAEVGWSIDFD